MADSEEIPDSLKFSIDQNLEETLCSHELTLSGWFFSTENPLLIEGLRIRSGRRVFPVRRKKRNRTAAAKFADCPWAEQTGFSANISLPFGCRSIQFEYREQNGGWRILEKVPVKMSRWALLSRFGFKHAAKAGWEICEQQKILNQPVFTGDELPDASPPLQNHSTRQVKIYACSGSNEFILEIARLINAGFLETGARSELVYDTLPLDTPTETLLQIVVTGHEFVAEMCSLHQIDVSEILASFSKCYLLSAEQPDTQWFFQTLNYSKYALGILDINSTSCKAYNRMGGDAIHFPLGFHASLAEARIPELSDRSNDVLFFGSNSGRRNEILGRLSTWLSSRSHLLFLVPLEVQKVASDPIYLTSARRTLALGKTKLVLNIHADNAPYFEWHRFLVATAHGCVLVTEPSDGYAPLTPFEHFIPSRAVFFPNICEYFLQNSALLETISRRTSIFVKENLQMSRFCNALLHRLYSSKQSPPGDAQPLIPGREILSEKPDKCPQRQFPSVSVGIFSSAVLQDLQNFADRSLYSVSARSGSVLTSTSLEPEKTAMEEAHEKRTTLLAAGEVVSSVISNAKWSCPGPPPVLSVVISVYNYSKYISQCLSSLEQCTLSDGYFEVVVVDDGSTDNSWNVVTGWMEKTLLPASVIRNRFNTGVAIARNDGIKASRGKYVFILDADNMVMPHSLQAHLSYMLKDPDIQAVYGIIAEFDEHISKRCGLISQYAWSPAFLTVRPYIDAMAMFQKETLIKMGGFDTEIYKHGWFGWEDYELWLRLSDSGAKVVGIPVICNLYRRHTGSMIQLTNRNTKGISAYLFERYSHQLETPLRKRYTHNSLAFGMNDLRTRQS